MGESMLDFWAFNVIGRCRWMRTQQLQQSILPVLSTHLLIVPGPMSRLMKPAAAAGPGPGA